MSGKGHGPHSQQVPGTARVGAVGGEGLLCAVIGQRSVEALIYGHPELKIPAHLRVKLDRHIEDPAADSRQFLKIPGRLCLKCKLPGAVLLQFPHRVLMQPAVPDGELSRHGHGAGPLEIVWCKVILPVVHPGYQHPPPIRGPGGLPGVEVHAVVDGLARLPGKGMGASVIAPYKAETAVAAVVLKAFCKHLLGGDYQHLLSVQGEEIRALPHFAVLVIAAIQYAHKAPASQVL